MVVTARAFQCHGQKSLRGVLNSLFEPGVTVPSIPIADDVPRGAQGFWIGWRNLITGEHLKDHTVVTLVFVERLNDPIAPMPHVPLTILHVPPGAPAIPVAVAPEVHPMPAPALAVRWPG